MVIVLTCSCGKHLQIGGDYAGQRGLCPACAAYVSIPAEAAASATLLEEGEIALPLLLAAPESASPAEPQPAGQPPVEVIEDLKEPELTPGSPPALTLDLGPEPGIPAPAASSPVAPTETVLETVVVQPLPLSALAPEKHELDFGERRDGTLPRYGLFPPQAVFLATLLGGLLAGTIVLACNYQTLRRWRAMRLTAAAGIGATAVFLAAMLVYPQFREIQWLRVALYALAAPLWVAVAPRFDLVEKTAILLPALAMVGVAWLLQARAYRDYLRHGGKRASVWTAAGMSLFCAIVPFVGISLHYGLYPYRPTDAKLLVLGDPPWQVHVYYQPGVDERDARRLGPVLVAHGQMDPDGVPTVYLTARGPGFIVSFVVHEHLWDDPMISQKIQALVPKLSQRLDGRPVRAELCNEDFTRKRRIP